MMQAQRINAIGALSIEQEDYTIPLEEALQKAVSLLRQALPA